MRELSEVSIKQQFCIQHSKTFVFPQPVCNCCYIVPSCREFWSLLAILVAISSMHVSKRRMCVSCFIFFVSSLVIRRNRTTHTEPRFGVRGNDANILQEKKCVVCTQPQLSVTDVQVNLRSC